MKLSEAIEAGKNRQWECAHLRRNPSDPKQWFTMLVDKKQMQYMLVDENEEHILNEDLNVYNDLFTQLNIDEFTVFL